MNSFVQNHYHAIADKTYRIFEIHHRHAVDVFMESDYTLRDIQMLNFIHKANQEVTAQLLVNMFRIANNTLSNRLAYFESHQIITRERGKIDSRQTIIKLAPQGQTLVDQYDLYIQGYIQKVRQNFGITQVSTVRQVLKKFNKVILMSSGLFPEELDLSTKDYLNANFLFNLNYYFASFDYTLVQMSEVSLTTLDTNLMLELYLFLLSGQSTMTTFAENMKIPYQSLISKIKKCEREGLIFESKQSKYQFSDKLIRHVENFMQQRIIVYYHTMIQFGEKEQAVIHKMFETLKDYALNLTNTD